jgi:methylase of polypeptide subunit release factors
VPERSNGAVLKTASPRGLVGSNPTPAASFTPKPDATAGARLGHRLRELGYNEEALLELFDSDDYPANAVDVYVFARRLPDSKLGIATRLLFLQQPVARADAERALGAGGLEALEATGLAEIGSTVSARGRISPTRELLLASDGFSEGDDDPPEYVATYTPAARLCDMLTPRPRVRRALDVGTGNGVHALLAAADAGTAVATDINDRALAFTALNAALNELENVETRNGSLFEPVAGEEFGLITCNAPFVVSPETRWVYRDGELPVDELSERVVREAAEHLADGGWATLAVSWVVRDVDAPNERPLDWVSEIGCDAWILSNSDADPLDHAASWNDHLSGADLEEALDRWSAYFSELGVHRIVEGAVILNRRDGETTVREDDFDSDDLEEADEQILRAFANRRLSDEQLLRAKLAPGTSVEQTLRGGRVVSASVALDGGTFSDVDVPPVLAEALAAGSPVRKRDLPVLRELAELGLLRAEA